MEPHVDACLISILLHKLTETVNGVTTWRYRLLLTRLVFIQSTFQLSPLSYLVACRIWQEWHSFSHPNKTTFWVQYGVKIFVMTSFKDTCYIEIQPKVQKSNKGMQLIPAVLKGQWTKTDLFSSTGLVVFLDIWIYSCGCSGTVELLGWGALQLHISSEWWVNTPGHCCPNNIIIMHNPERGLLYVAEDIFCCLWKLQMHRGRKRRRRGDGGRSRSTTTIDGGFQRAQAHHLHPSGTWKDASTVDLVTIDGQVVSYLGGRHRPNGTSNAITNNIQSRPGPI